MTRDEQIEFMSMARQRHEKMMAELLDNVVIREVVSRPAPGQLEAENKRLRAKLEQESIRAAYAELAVDRLRAEAAEAEVLEQAKLNGMGAERELALKARLAEAERIFEAIIEIANESAAFVVPSRKGVRWQNACNLARKFMETKR